MRKPICAGAVRRVLRALAAAGAFGLTPMASLIAQPMHDGPRRDVAPELVSEGERAIVLRRSSSAVALAVGNVGALLTDADVLFYNPAMLTQARGMSASVQRDGRDAATGAIASVQTFGALGVGLGARLTTSPAERFESSLALTAGAARALGPARLGVAGTYAREADRGALSVDVAGVLPFGPGDALGVSVIVQHLGATIAPNSVFGNAKPWRTVVAFGGRNYPLATFFDLSAYTQMSIDADGTQQLAGGAELAWVPLEGVAVAVRGGARNARPIERPFTAGLGMTLDRWSIDYAVELDPEQRRDGRAVHRIGLRIR
jgi:hypothetical protein